MNNPNLVTEVAAEETILVIDDDAMIRLLATEALKDAGYKVLSAANGELGLKLFETAAVDLTLVDIMMPGMTGYKACAQIQGFLFSRPIPAVLFEELLRTRTARPVLRPQQTAEVVA